MRMGVSGRHRLEEVRQQPRQEERELRGHPPSDFTVWALLRSAGAAMWPLHDVRQDTWHTRVRGALRASGAHLYACVNKHCPELSRSADLIAISIATRCSGRVACSAAKVHLHNREGACACGRGGGGGGGPQAHHTTHLVQCGAQQVDSQIGPGGCARECDGASCMLHAACCASYVARYMLCVASCMLRGVRMHRLLEPWSALEYCSAPRVRRVTAEGIGALDTLYSLKR